MKRIFEHLKTSRDLWRLNAAHSETVKAFEKDRAIARKENKGQEAIRKIDEDEHFERRMINDQITQIKSQRLYRLAGRYDVPVSMDKDWWEESSAVGRMLSPKGFSELRSSIRKEQNERWSYWELRVKLIVVFVTAMTGVIGALIGLATILKD